MTLPPLPLGSIVAVLRDRSLLVELRGPADTPVTGASQDSRTVGAGDLFLAWRGVEYDAHDFVADAAERGAAAAVVERPVEADLPQVVVTDGRAAGAVAADVLAGSPWRRLRVVGVTGTNGKTTTSLLARHLLAAVGPAAALGTLGLVEADGSVRPGTEGLTTPGPVQLSGWLRELADAGIRSVVMEASSHALEQRRLDGIRFDTAVYTNLGQDHLDYHPDLEAYRSAKLRLLDLVEEGGTAVVNRDDAAWEAVGRPGVRRLGFAVDADDAELRARDLDLGESGSRFRLTLEGEEAPVDLPLLGRFNVENALAAAGAAAAAGLPLPRAAERLGGAPQVPGRLEMVVREPFPVLVDFAHTPDALERVLATLRPLVRGRLVVVFGAGGDRDRTKRPRMGRAVARWADEIVVTSDNPRTEDPDAIIDDIVAGIPDVPYHRVPDRREGIRRALELAEPGDLVLLAGKGHERYQVVGRERLPLDEREVVREALGVAVDPAGDAPEAG